MTTRRGFILSAIAIVATSVSLASGMIDIRKDAALRQAAYRYRRATLLFESSPGPGPPWLGRREATHHTQPRRARLLELPPEPVNGFWIYASPDNANGIHVEGGDYLKPGEHGRYERVNGEWTRAE